MCRHKVASTRRAGSPWRSPRGGLTVTGGWSCGRCTLGGVSSKLCVVLGGVLVKQQYHYLHWWRSNTTCIVIACSPYLYHAPGRRFGSSAAVSSSLPPTLERHLGGLVCVSRTSPPGVGRGAPPRFVSCPGAKCAWHPGRHRDQCRLLW